MTATVTLPVDLGVCANMRRHIRTKELQYCTAPAVALVIAGCVHEHITEARTCARHLDRMQQGKTLCQKCADGRDPHRCELLGRVMA